MSTQLDLDDAAAPHPLAVQQLAELRTALLQVAQAHAPLAWTDDRCKEIDELGTLLREVARINNGSNCLERIQRCIVLAEKLSRDDLFTCRDSLTNFLRGLAIADRITGPLAERSS